MPDTDLPKRFAKIVIRELADIKPATLATAMFVATETEKRVGPSKGVAELVLPLENLFEWPSFRFHATNAELSIPEGVLWTPPAICSLLRKDGKPHTF